MANLSDQKTLQNKSAVMGPTIVHADDLADLDPAPYVGSFAYSADGRMYFSNGSVWRTTEDPPVKTPTAVSPSSTTAQRQLTLSTFLNSSTSPDLQFKQIGIVFQVSLSPTMSPLIMQKELSTTKKNAQGNDIEWPTVNSYNLLATDTIPNLTPGKTFYWRGKYLATAGQASGFSKIFEQKFPELIDTPTPKTGTGLGQVQNYIEVTPYKSPFEIENLYPPFQIEWLLSLDNFKTSFPGIKTDITSGNPFDTFKFIREAGTTFYWKARYYSTPASAGGSKVSAYSPVGINVQVKDVLTPATINVPGVTAKTVRLKLSPYSSVTKKARIRTEWLVADSLENLEVLQTNAETVRPELTNNSDSLDILTLPAAILADSSTIYYWKARYINSDNIASDFSPTDTFVRYPEFVTPAIITVKNADTKTLTISDFKSEYSTIYPYESTEWVLYDITTNQVLVPATPTVGNTFDVFSYSETSLQPGKQFKWTARQKNKRGAYSTLVQSENYQIPWIDTPKAISTGNTSSLISSQYSSAYFVRAKFSVITITGPDDVNIIITSSADSNTINKFERLLGYSSELIQGTTYNWKVMYIGETARGGTVTSKESSVSSYVQPDIVKTPVIKTPTEAQINGPKIDLSSSDLALYTSPGIVKAEHLYSDWEMSTNPGFTQSGYVDSVSKSTIHKTTWTTDKLKINTAYYVRVRYYSDVGKSYWSDTSTYLFKTPDAYNHSLNYTPIPRQIAKEYPAAGGYYAGDIWHYATSATNSAYTIGGPSTVKNGVPILFKVPNMQFAPLFYLGQKVQIRSQEYPRYIQIEGVVRIASADELTIEVTNVFKDSSITANSIIISTWVVMSLYRIILSYKSKGEVSGTNATIRGRTVTSGRTNYPDSGNGTGWGTNATNTMNFALLEKPLLEDPDYFTPFSSSSTFIDWPDEFLSLSDGSLIQKAMWRHSWLVYALSQIPGVVSDPVERANTKYLPENLYPLAHYVYEFNKVEDIAKKANTDPTKYYFSDWYAPSRDELEVCFRNLTPTEPSTTAGQVSTTRGIYYDTSVSVSSQFLRLNSAASVYGQISDSYSTDLTYSPTIRTANGSNNNSKPIVHAYAYKYNDLNSNGTKAGFFSLKVPPKGYVTPYLKTTLEKFAFNGTESLLKAGYLTMISTSTSDTVPTDTAKNHRVFTMYVAADLSFFGKQGVVLGENSSSYTRLIRRELA